QSKPDCDSEAKRPYSPKPCGFLSALSHVPLQANTDRDVPLARVRCSHQVGSASGGLGNSRASTGSATPGGDGSVPAASSIFFICVSSSSSFGAEGGESDGLGEIRRAEICSWPTPRSSSAGSPIDTVSALIGVRAPFSLLR